MDGVGVRVFVPAHVCAPERNTCHLCRCLLCVHTLVFVGATQVYSRACICCVSVCMCVYRVSVSTGDTDMYDRSFGVTQPPCLLSASLLPFVWPHKPGSGPRRRPESRSLLVGPPCCDSRLQALGGSRNLVLEPFPHPFSTTGSQEGTGHSTYDSLVR